MNLPVGRDQGCINPDCALANAAIAKKFATTKVANMATANGLAVDGQEATILAKTAGRRVPLDEGEGGEGRTRQRKGRSKLVGGKKLGGSRRLGG